MSQHLETEEIAAYLSHGLPSTARSNLEAHLAACRLCRREVISARRLVRTRSFRNRLPILLPAAIAAGLAISLVGRAVLAPTVVQPAVRGSTATDEVERAATIQALSPAEGALVARNAVRFTWSGDKRRPLYRLTLTEASGRALWLQDTRDSTLALPSDVTLSQGMMYYWYVDALNSDGSALTTGTHRFSVKP